MMQPHKSISVEELKSKFNENKSTINVMATKDNEEKEHLSDDHVRWLRKQLEELESDKMNLDSTRALLLLNAHANKRNWKQGSLLPMKR